MRATTVANQGMFSVTVQKPATNLATTAVPRTTWPETVQTETRAPMMTASATDVAGQVTCLVIAPIMKEAVAANVIGKMSLL